MKFAKAFLTLTLAATLMLTACSTAWIGEAEQIVAALVPAAGEYCGAGGGAAGEERFGERS